MDDKLSVAFGFNQALKLDGFPTRSSTKPEILAGIFSPIKQGSIRDGDSGNETPTLTPYKLLKYGTDYNLSIYFDRLPHRY